MTRIGSSHHTDRAYFRKVAEWIADVAEALDYAHGLGVIHRDVKPSNLLLAADGRMMISDFGLARANGAQSLTASRSLLGTCRYMSPEQVDDSQGPIDHRIDVYALGATLYELLAFKPMFAATDDREVLNDVLNKEPAPPHRFVRQVPRELETICLKAVEKDRVARYQTAEAVAQDLRRWLLDLPIHARRPSLPTRALKFVRRRKALTTAISIAAVLLLTTTVLLAGYQQSRRQAAEAASLAQDNKLEALILSAEADYHAERYAASLAKFDEALADDPASPDLRRGQAKVLWDMGRRDEALHAVEALSAQDANDWQAHSMLARMYRHLGEDEKAKPHSKRAVDLMPETGQAYLLRAAEESDPSAALELVDKAIELGPPQAQFFFKRSMVYYELGRFDAMLLDAQRAAGMMDGFAAAHAQVGLAFCSTGRCDEALLAYSRAIEREPESPLWWRNRAVANFKTGSFAKAIADASEAVQLDPTYAKAHAIRAHARSGLGDLDAALADFDRAIALAPTDPENYLSRSLVHAQAGRWRKQICDCRRVLELVPDDPRAYTNRALAYMQLKEYEPALTDLGHLVRLSPDDPRIYRTRGEVYGHLRRYEEAIDDFTQAMQLEPGFPDDFHNRALCAWKADRYEESTADWTVLIQMGRNLPKNYRHRGLCFLRTSRYEAALDDFGQVIELAPHAAGSYALRGAAHISMQRFDAAIDDLTKALELAPHDASLLLHRGMAFELAGEEELAISDYDSVGKRGNQAGKYAALWKCLLLRRNGRDDEALELLAVAGGYSDDQTWTDELFGLFASEITREQLLSAAANDDERAEALYYIGMHASLAGDKYGAIDAWEKCLAMNRSRILETDFARARLRLLQNVPPGATVSHPPGQQ